MAADAPRPRLVTTTGLNLGPFSSKSGGHSEQCATGDFSVTGASRLSRSVSAVGRMPRIENGRLHKARARMRALASDSISMNSTARS